MNAEVISIGTELLLGQIVNTDAAFVAHQLAGLGINLYYQSVVGDNPAKIIEQIKIAEGRSDLFIFIGGLGPTEDDLTKETIAEYLDEPLILDPATLEGIRHYFEEQGREMTPNNHKQATYFQNGRFFKNSIGQALGTYIEKNGVAYLLLPGPPKELERMFENEVAPFLVSLVKEQQFIQSKTLRFYGIGESTLAHHLEEIISNQTNPTVAPYAAEFEVSLRITANGADEEACTLLLEDMKEHILSIVGDYCYGEGESNSLAEVVATLLADQGLKLSAAESLTGGLFQAELVKVPQIGSVFRGGIVSYEQEIKQDVLKVPKSILEGDGMVSEACAIAMADNCREMFETDLAISFTGVAGPDSLEGEPPGTVWIGISQKGKESFAKKYRFMNDRDGNRGRSVKQGLDLLRRELLQK